MTFVVRWVDGSESEEPWEMVKKLAALDKYIAQNPSLKRLAQKGWSAYSLAEYTL